MDKEAVLEKITDQQPRLIYVSGKTCTGKTTFAHFLEQHGYKKVELDKVVTHAVVIPFNVQPGDGFRTAYRDEGPREQTSAFTDAAKLEIIESLKTSSLVVEGAIAKPRILGEIFSGELKDFVFVYFHPIHADVYEQRILSRFIGGAKDGTAGLPKDFWALVQEPDLEEFKKTDVIVQGIHQAIKQYAAKSMEESKVRLEGFRVSFPDIAVVEL
jgi:hypothetical protein